MTPLFSAGVPSSQVKLIEANRDRVQEWYDKTPQFHVIDAEHRTGVKYPNFILCWGGNISVDKIAMNTQTMVKDYRTLPKHVSFIFWDVAPGHVQSCIQKIQIPDICLQCGSKSDLSPQNSKIFNLNTIPDTRSYYNLNPSAVFTGKYCPKCGKKTRIITGAYQKDAHFLTISLDDVDSKAAYRAIVDHNAEHMVPYFKVLAWQQITEGKLLEALKK
jgi:hypothetical protein